MITIDAKYLVRPITHDMAMQNFKQGHKVMAYDGEPNNVIGFQIFLPEHHTLSDIKNWGYTNSKWFADWS